MMDEQFLKQSSKSYQKCQVANSARRNSLLKKTIGYERERKLTSHQLDKEERQLRQQLRNMKIEQSKNSITSEARGGVGAGSRKSNKKSSSSSSSPNTTFVEPYPVTFGHSSLTVFRQRSFTMNHTEEGMRFAARRGRRVSKEFEDLTMNTSTGQLAIPLYLLRNRSKVSQSSSGSASPTTPRRGLNGSVSSLDSSDNSHWPGDPEAIQSVRRPRKSVTQQDREKYLRKKREVSPQ